MIASRAGEELSVGMYERVRVVSWVNIIGIMYWYWGVGGMEVEARKSRVEGRGEITFPTLFVHDGGNKAMLGAASVLRRTRERRERGKRERAKETRSWPCPLNTLTNSMRRMYATDMDQELKHFKAFWPFV